MQFSKTHVTNAWLIDPSPHKDERGRFMRAWCKKEFTEHKIQFTPVQANMGFSVNKGTIRGMHYQKTPASEAKLVRCTKGAIFDVALDINPKSPTYTQWIGAELNPLNARMLYVPKNCAHGYQTLEENTEIHYMTSAYYTPNLVRGIRYDDPAFKIQWPIPITVISDQDSQWPLLKIRK
jgi:dTDP-4-dehydrorhamnose 3,5-epimerase